MWHYKEPLKKCPFCGSKEFYQVCEKSDFCLGYIAFIKCKKCGATHEWCYAKTEEEVCKRATEKWNTRAKIL